jgi:hypothetical protein
MCTMMNPEFNILIYQNMQRISEQILLDSLSLVSMFHAFLNFFPAFFRMIQILLFFLAAFFFLAFSL